MDSDRHRPRARHRRLAAQGRGLRRGHAAQPPAASRVCRAARIRSARDALRGHVFTDLVHRRAARGRRLGRPRRVRVPQRAVLERVLLALLLPCRGAARLARDRRRRRRAARRRCPSAAAAGDAHRAPADGRGHDRRRARHCDAEVELAVPRVPRRQGTDLDRRSVGVPDVRAARTHVGRAPRSGGPAARRADR